MNLSRSFMRDFAYLANLYRWSPADIEDVKARHAESRRNVRLPGRVCRGLPRWLRLHAAQLALDIIYLVNVA